MRRVRSSSGAGRHSIVTIVFCSGFIIFLLGIVLEYLALLVLNAHGKPIFFIADRRSDAVLVAYFAERRIASSSARRTGAGAPGRQLLCCLVTG